MDSSYARWWFWGWFSFQFCRKVVYGKNIFPQTKHLLYEKKKRMMVMCMFTYLQADKDKKFSVYVHSRPGFLFHKATTKSLFFLNRQVNNSVQVLFFSFWYCMKFMFAKSFLCMFILDKNLCGISYMDIRRLRVCLFSNMGNVVFLLQIFPLLKGFDLLHKRCDEHLTSNPFPSSPYPFLFVPFLSFHFFLVSHIRDSIRNKFL